MQSILTNLADNYPQAPAAGGTLKMREAIKEVNRLEDEENDFIYANSISLKDYLELGKDE